MIDILFVVPSFAPQLKEESMGTLILAKIAMASNFNVHILRYWEVCEAFSSYYHFKKKMIERVLLLNPKIVSFYSRCTDYHISVDLSNELKSQNKNLLIVFGGPQAELVAQETLEKFSSIDFICCSEGETTIVPFLTVLLRNKDYSLTLNTIRGLVYRDKEGNICKNPLPQLRPNDYHSVVNYYDIIPDKVLKSSHRTTLAVGRGCPFSCIFCSTKTFWKRKFRLRNIHDIVDEIEFVVKNIGITRFDLDHDLFTVNRTKIIEFCNELKSRNLSIDWHCSSRIDTIDKKLIDIMADNGLYKIMFGIESASDRIQNIIRKNLNLDDCYEIVKYCRSKGLRIITSFIYGLPEDTEDDFEKTFRMMQDFEYMGVNVAAYLCGILNGTELYGKYHKQLIFSDDNVKNHKYFGLLELRDLVSQNPTIFPHVYDIDIPFRMKLRYFEVFRNIWNGLFPQTFRYISSVFLESNLRYLDMYYMFVDSNNITIKQSDFEDKLFGLSKQQCVGLTENFILSINDLIHSDVISQDNYNRIFNLFTKECSIITETNV